MDYDEEEDGIEAPELTTVHLLYADAPAVGSEALVSAVRAALPEADTRIDSGELETLFVVHRDHVIEYDDGVDAPAMTLLVLTPQPVSPDHLAGSMAQTRHWPEARQVAASCRWQLTVMEMMSSRLPPHTRLSLLGSVLRQAMNAAPPAAVHWVSAGKLSEPGAVLQALESAQPADALLAAVNVRLFEIEGSSGDWVADTMGLTGLGLPDVQMHFRGLDPDAVAGLLLDAAVYLYRNGDCIEDGHTVEGIGPGERWRCRHDMALVEPSRVVLDVDPGPRHAAAGARRPPEPGGNGSSHRGPDLPRG